MKSEVAAATEAPGPFREAKVRTTPPADTKCPTCDGAAYLDTYTSSRPGELPVRRTVIRCNASTSHKLKLRKLTGRTLDKCPVHVVRDEPIEGAVPAELTAPPPQRQKYGKRPQVRTAGPPTPVPEPTAAAAERRERMQATAPPKSYRRKCRKCGADFKAPGPSYAFCEKHRKQKPAQELLPPPSEQLRGKLAGPVYQVDVPPGALEELVPPAPSGLEVVEQDVPVHARPEPVPFKNGVPQLPENPVEAAWKGLATRYGWKPELGPVTDWVDGRFRMAEDLEAHGDGVAQALAAALPDTAPIPWAKAIEVLGENRADLFRLRRQLTEELEALGHDPKLAGAYHLGSFTAAVLARQDEVRRELEEKLARPREAIAVTLPPTPARALGLLEQLPPNVLEGVLHVAREWAQIQRMTEVGS